MSYAVEHLSFPNEHYCGHSIGHTVTGIQISGCGGLSETGYNNATFVADTLMVSKFERLLFNQYQHAQTTL